MSNQPKISVKKCKECKSDFESPTYKMRSFCSHKCSNTYGNRKRSEQLQQKRVCRSCAKVFYKRPSDLKLYKSAAKNKHQYCSIKCWKDKTQTIRSLKIKAWGVFSLYIKNRDNWTCFTCGKHEQSRNMHGGHFISRRHNSTLFDERNVHAQCSGCNMYRNGEPHLYAQKLAKIHGHEWLDKLIEDSKVTKKFTREELLEICEKYKSMTPTP